MVLTVKKAILMPDFALKIGTCIKSFNLQNLQQKDKYNQGVNNFNLLVDCCWEYQEIRRCEGSPVTKIWS